MKNENLLRALSLVKSRGSLCMEYLEYKTSSCDTNCYFNHICSGGYSPKYAMNYRYNAAVDLLQKSDQQEKIFEVLL